MKPTTINVIQESRAIGSDPSTSFQIEIGTTQLLSKEQKGERSVARNDE